MRPSSSDNSTTAQSRSANWHAIKSLLPYLLHFKYRVIAALSCMVLAKLASVTLPFVLKHIVDGLESPSQLAIATPLALVAVYGIARFSNVLLNELRDTIFGRVTERSIRRIGLTTFKHLHALDIGYHLNRRTGGLSRDIERGTSGINVLMRFTVFNIAPTLLEVLMIVGIFSYNYDISFSIITLCSVCFYIAYTIWATEWRSQYIREANAADSASNTRAVDSLLNYETVKYFNNEQFEAQRYDSELQSWEVAKRKNRLSLFTLNAGQALIIAISMTAMLALAAHHTREGNMTIGDFVLINAFMLQLFIPLNFLGFVYREIKAALINIEQMFTLLEKKASITDKSNAKTLGPIHTGVSFNEVSFHYQADREILKHINFTLPVGKKIAIVGESGSGKSSIVKLLFRFYDVTGGSIAIDGVDIRDFSQQSLRQAIAIVPQDTVLFNDSIFENIRYGRTDATDAEIAEVIRMAHLEHFITALPQGLQTRVGERGLKLSGGEKQRVAIARALLKKPQILVFDEATSSLDSHSEKNILQAMAALKNDYTRLVIAHRLSTIVDADNIVVLHEGEIVEQGQHQQLLLRQGAYAKLWHSQQKQEMDAL